jgi:hypothetical protein
MIAPPKTTEGYDVNKLLSGVINRGLLDNPPFIYS